MNAETFCEHFATFAGAPNGIAKLRELILQLAVQGKLCTHDVNDEPASDQVANLTQQANQESPFSLPPNWRWIALSVIATVVRGVSYQKHDASAINQPEYVPLLRANNIGVSLNFDDLVFVPKKCVSPEQFVKTDDVVIAMSSGSKNLVGKAAQAESDFAGGFGAFCGVIRLNAAIDAKFFGMFFRSPYYRERIASEGKGIGINNVQKGSLLALPVPIPPLAEQRRIVEKVDQLLGLCDELATRQAAQREKRQRLVGATLDRLVSTRNPAEFPTHAHRLRNHFDQLFDTPTTIPQLRQTILQLAVQGQLIPVRRSEEVTVETLLSMERERMSLSFANGDQPKLESEYAALRASGPNQDGSPRYISARCICDFITKGTTPAANELMPQGDVPFLKVYNIVKNVLNFEYKPTFVRQTVHETELRRSKIQPGNVLMNLVGPPLGKVAVVTDEYPEWNCNQALVIFKPISFYDSQFLSYIIGCPATLKEVLEDTRGTAGQDNISLEQSRNLRIPLVSLQYQRRFIAEVNKLLSLCDALEAKLTQAESASTQLLSAAVHQLLNGAVANV